MNLSELNHVDADIIELLQTHVYWHDWEINLNESNYTKIYSVCEKFKHNMSLKDQSANYYYEQRNAYSPLGDITLGKFGEFAVCLALRSIGFPKIMPDVSIRHGYQKGWDCDLPFKKYDERFFDSHVKTCDHRTSEFVQRFRQDKYTWTFQWSNKNGIGGRDKLFDDPDNKEVVWFMYVPSMSDRNPKLIASAPWFRLKNILKDPIANKLKGLKKCIYSEDLWNMSLAKNVK